MKNQVIQFYESTRQYYLTYHNHKELSAWAGLGLEGLICTIITAATLKGNQCLINYILAIFEIIMCIFLYKYINNQLIMKQIGADYTAAATLILSEIILAEESNFDSNKYLRINKHIDNKNAQSAYVLPEYLLAKSKDLHDKGSGFHDKTKRTITILFVLIALATLFGRFGLMTE